MDLRGKRVLVVGLARTGVATARFCAARGARVSASDSRSEAEIGPVVSQLKEIGCTLEVGAHTATFFSRQDLIVPSPGVPADLPALVGARTAGIPVWSEIELASRFLSGRLIAVTGSNGKTTTTSLIGHILKEAGLKTIVAGNIGTPLVSCVEESSNDSITVAEVSSFQLELIESFRPNISVILNITPDHLDRHGSFEDYCSAKLNIFRNQNEADIAVLNADDDVLPRRAPTRPQLHWFSRLLPVAAGTCIQGEQIFFRDGARETRLLGLSEVQLRGVHNVENVLAAASAAWLAGVPATAIASGVRSFPGVEHRLEFVAEIGGVKFFNDSKATNVDAAMKAIAAFSRGVFIILGGKDKGSDYRPLVEPLRERAKLVLLIGAAAAKIESQIGAQLTTVHAGKLEGAVSLAWEQAQPGDTILLSPACASFDQFENYEHRGRAFKELVAALENKNANAIKMAKS
jgi:UDP-N-acetylmuramoylalanine--D-glutamate ligase